MTTHSLNHFSDTVINGPELPNATLLDFWQWAMADLCDDDVKGFFAEWLVHKLLAIESARRVSWANSDVVTPHGITIEVKATAYWQSWKVLDQHGRPKIKRTHGATPDSAIRFGGLRARDSATVADMSAERKLKSDIYVFAFQHERDITRWNAMDLSQWEFYVLRTDELALLATGRSVSLSKVRSLKQPLSAAQFARVATDLVGVITRERNATQLLAQPPTRC